MFTKKFWRLAGERAIKSFAQSLAALLGASGLGLLDAPWLTLMSLAGMAGLLSVLTSLASTQVGPADDPSAVSPLPPAAPATATLQVAA